MFHFLFSDLEFVLDEPFSNAQEAVEDVGTASSPKRQEGGEAARPQSLYTAKGRGGDPTAANNEGDGVGGDGSMEEIATANSADAAVSVDAGATIEDEDEDEVTPTRSGQDEEDCQQHQEAGKTGGPLVNKELLRSASTLPPASTRPEVSIL